MRSVQVQVNAVHTPRVLELAREHGARSAVGVGAVDETAILFVTLPNERVGVFVDAVRGDVDEATFVVLPVGALPLQTPLDRLDESVRDVSRLSTLELVLASLQSVGSWRGLLIYSVLAGLIGAYGLVFDAAYLLVAAMLVNPMGAPALVAVTAIAVGDARMFARGAVRFATSLAVQAFASLAFGFAYRLSTSTAMMEQVTALSSWAVLIAAAAGAAGAQTQIKSERDSLVSGTAAGFMVAAALAPPAAVLGLAVPLGRFDYMALMAFLLVLQFLAIVAGGWLTLHMLGVRPAEPSVGRGTPRVRTALAVSMLALTAGLVAWQTTAAPRFQRADLSRTALEIARDATDHTADVHLIEASARFTRRDLSRYPGEALLLELVVENAGEVTDATAADSLRARVRRIAAQRLPDVVPFIAVTTVPGPARAPSRTHR